MKIKRELKYATFEYDDEDKSITIETNSREGDNPLNGRIHLDKVYSFALLRFVIRIAQRNWYRKMKKVIKGDNGRQEDFTEVDSEEIREV
jgi:hypothetical protein